MTVFEAHQFHYVYSAQLNGDVIDIQFCDKNLKKTHKQKIYKPLTYRDKRFSTIEESFDLLIAAINEDWQIYINSLDKVLTKTDMLDIKKWQDE